MGEIPKYNQQPITTLDVALAEVAPLNNERREIQHQIERYYIETFSEVENPEGALRAQQIQGESYVAAGFVYPSALDQWGRLDETLDRSRGPNITYKLATAIDADPSDTQKDQASLRINSIPTGGRLDDLTEYKYCKNVMSIETELSLRQLIAERGTESVKGIAALSKTNEAHPTAPFELIRDILQEAIRDETNETWLITFARPAYEAIKKNFGDRAMHQIAEPVAVDVGDDRTNDELRLVPCVIRPCEVLDGLVQDIREETDDRRRMSLVRSLYFVADGLKEEEMSQSVNETIAFIEKLRA